VGNFLGRKHRKVLLRHIYIFEYFPFDSPNVTNHWLQSAAIFCHHQSTIFQDGDDNVWATRSSMCWVTAPQVLTND
jgi:hypothetical protein